MDHGDATAPPPDATLPAPPPVPPKPNPVKHPHISDPENVPAKRKLNCRIYNSCLSIAMKAEWAGFACTSCSVHEPIGRNEELRDIEGMASMLFARTELIERRPNDDS